MPSTDKLTTASQQGDDRPIDDPVAHCAACPQSPEPPPAEPPSPPANLDPADRRNRCAGLGPCG